MATIYKLIAALEEFDLLESREVEDSTTGAMIVRYRLTGRGREAQETWK
jgi:DNA-binding PadR family transcriptional regulator